MPPYMLLMEESVVRAATRDGLLKTTTSATIVAAMTARLVALPSAFTKPQTPVPWSSLPVTTVTTESKAVLMDQKMTALGASQRGERSIGAIARAIGGATTNADAGPSSAATERRIAFDCIISRFGIAVGEPSFEKSKMCISTCRRVCVVPWRREGACGSRDHHREGGGLLPLLYVERGSSEGSSHVSMRRSG